MNIVRAKQPASNGIFYRELLCPYRGLINLWGIIPRSDNENRVTDQDEPINQVQAGLPRDMAGRVDGTNLLSPIRIAW